MKTKKLLTVISSICLFLAIAVSPIMSAYGQPAPKPAPTPQKLIVLRAVMLHTSPWEMNEPFEELVRRINEKGKGKVRIDILGGPEVAGPFEAPGMLKRGAIDFLFSAVPFFAGDVKGCTVDEFIRASCAKRRASGFFDYYNKMHRKHGIVTLGYTVLAYPGKGLFTNKPEMAKTLDWGPYKFRVVPTEMPIAVRFGGKPVRVTMEEQYSALQQGVVDAAIGPLVGGLLEAHLPEVVKYYIYPHPPIEMTGGPYMRAEQWDNLPEDVKKIIMDEMLKIEPWVEDFFAKRQDKVIETAEKKYGMKRLDMAPEIAKKYLEEGFKAMWDKWVTKEVPDQEPVIRGMVKEMTVVPGIFK